ncbi:DNA polymerase IV [Candidatus Marsarchaeota archaeon]|nr:DNA polymerase IV [Candidatus Marsarchaeota archaeon]
MLVDMDYFYVACEELRHPEIREVPAVVGMDPKGGKGRGVVMTCNYKAREFGLRSGMPISTAYRLKPDAVYLSLDYDYYEGISKKIMEVIRSFADKFEQVSIDEAFIDTTDRVRSENPKDYAQRIKSAILEKTGIKCSIGIGPNKLIAKMACGKSKPNGIMEVNENEVGQFLSGMRIDDLYGIGAKTAEKLEKLGYATVSELAGANRARLVGKLGSFGSELIDYANGIDDSEVMEDASAKSVSREFTFESDTNKEEEIAEVIKRLGTEVVAELNRSQECFRTVTVKIRYGDFTEHVHSRSVKVTSDPDTLIDTAMELYKENANADRKIRKLGVRASNLSNYRGQRRIA